MGGEPSVLIVKPGSIAEADRELLRAAGIVAVETDDPGSVRLVQPTADLSASELMAVAAAAIKADVSVRADFAYRLCNAILDKAGKL